MEGVRYIFTEEDILCLLKDEDFFLASIVDIDDLQEPEERDARTCFYKDGKGWSKYHVDDGGAASEKIRYGGRLNSREFSRMKSIMKKYRRQLVKLANSRD